MVKALDLSSNGRVVRVGSNPTPGNYFHFNSLCQVLKFSFLVTNFFFFFFFFIDNTNNTNNINI